MTSFYSLPSLSSEQVSIEANSDGLVFQPNQVDTSFLDDFDFSFGSEMILPNEINVAGHCDSASLAVSMNHCAEPNEFDKYLGPDHLTSPTFDIDQELLVQNGLPTHMIEKPKRSKPNKRPIPLSASVGVGMPQKLSNVSHRIEIVNPLELKYRPRYKSDYFAQSGKLRKPRYITDRHGNHFITLKVPVGVHGKIRVDWLTVPTEDGKTFYMPYRFQADNEKAEVPDCNPIHIDITHESPGTLKLYLVLIKAKQDALKSLQPLVPYHPLKDVFGITDKKTPEKTARLTPKQLISKYQLGKSRLAFTLCSIGVDGQPCPQWDTTAYSTVIEEECTDTTAGKTVACPKCAFPVPINDDGVTEEETATNKRKGLTPNVEKPKPVKKQRSITELLTFD